ncbi:hypothetical protein RI129_004140 [Pyrocoelia pectoralis]|uniref:Reverse transcriptase domain-containing protein n=1 Tax=Pyrocoelia pectoralis TaxID=417401 RepID=A0AAN7VHZ7_9COLE
MNRRNKNYESTYFLYDNKFYKQIQGTPMGSPLSPALANIYMEDFEEKAINSFALKPKYWYRYVDDTFVIWNHGAESLNNFLDHLNNIHPNIKFRMEVENNNTIPFLDTLLTKLPNRKFLHSVYRKPTHTNKYLNALSHHQSPSLSTTQCYEVIIISITLLITSKLQK